MKNRKANPRAKFYIHHESNEIFERLQPTLGEFVAKANNGYNAERICAAMNAQHKAETESDVTGASV